MPNATHATVETRTIRLVSEIALASGHAAPVRATSTLAEVGLTSMDLVNLMLGVEAEFDIALPQSDINGENFRSVDSIVAMIERQFAHQKAA